MCLCTYKVVSNGYINSKETSRREIQKIVADHSIAVTTSNNERRLKNKTIDTNVGPKKNTRDLSVFSVLKLHVRRG